MNPHVFIASSSSAAYAGASRINAEAPYLIIYPSRDQFNDFGTSSRVEYLVGRGGEVKVEHLMGKMLIAPLETQKVVQNTGSFLEKVAKNARSDGGLSPFSKALEGNFFLGALLDSDQYVTLISSVGRQQAQELLLEAHDLAALRLKEAVNSDIMFFENTSAYGQSLLRLDSTFIAVFGFDNQLNGPEQVAARVARPEIIEIEDASLEKGLLRLSFSPDALGSNRLNVLVGPNGTGKTKLLKALARTSADMSHGQIVFVPSPLDGPSAFNNLGSSRVKAHPATERGWTDLTRQLSIILRSKTEYSQLKRSVEAFIELDQLMLPLKETADLSNSFTIKIHEQYYAQLEYLANAPEGKRTETMGWIDLDCPPLVATQAQPRNLSSGERALLGMSCILLAEVPQSGLILLDEPELSLHPRMIAEFMRLLGFLLETRQAHCVIATHSLYVVRETSSPAVHVLKRSADSKKIHDFEPMIQTLGAGLTELSNVIFDDWEIQEYFERRVVEFLSRQHTPEEIKAALLELGESARESFYEQLNRGRDEVA